MRVASSSDSSLPSRTTLSPTMRARTRLDSPSIARISSSSRLASAGTTLIAKLVSVPSLPHRCNVLCPAASGITSTWPPSSAVAWITLPLPTATRLSAPARIRWTCPTYRSIGIGGSDASEPPLACAAPLTTHDSAVASATTRRVMQVFIRASPVWPPERGQTVAATRPAQRPGRRCGPARVLQYGPSRRAVPPPAHAWRPECRGHRR